MKQQTPISILLREYASAPDDVPCLTQAHVAAVLGKSESWAERARWAGTGPEFTKIGRHARYAKAWVEAFIRKHPVRRSTTSGSESE